VPVRSTPSTNTFSRAWQSPASAKIVIRAFARFSRW
jgi:hypothetical protein